MFRKIFLFLNLFLISCVETVVIGTVVGSAVVLNDGTVFDLTQDSRIKTAIKKSFKENSNYEYLKNVDIDVYNAKILLSGYVNNIKYKELAVSITKKTKPDIKVYDEIMIFGENYKTSSLNDSYIHSKIATRLKVAEGIKSSNYIYNVVDSIVFVMGRARNKKEFEKIIKIFRTTKGVKKVVSYIFILEEKVIND